MSGRRIRPMRRALWWRVPHDRGWQSVPRKLKGWVVGVFMKRPTTPPQELFIPRLPVGAIHFASGVPRHHVSDVDPGEQKIGTAVPVHISQRERIEPRLTPGDGAGHGAKELAGFP